MNKPRMLTFALFIILAVSGLLYYATISPQQFGSGHDDSVYVTTAKALATGQGYRIISLPYEPAQTKYPPFYPFLLSIIWRIYPQFPENLPWMMLLSAGAAVGFLGITFRYLVKQRYATDLQALIVVGLAAINWRTQISATSIYTEMVYSLLSVAILHLAEKYEKPESKWNWQILVGVLIGLAFLTRTLGITLLLAVVLYYALKREWRKTVVVAGVSTLFVVGWVAWCYANGTSAEFVNVAYYTNYWRDFDEVFTTMQANSNMPRAMVMASVTAKNALGLILLSVPIVCLGISYESVVYFGFAFLFVAAGFVRQIRTRLRLLHIYLVCYLLINLPVPYTSYDRYLIPLLPFLLLFMVIEFQAIASVVRNQVTSKGPLINRIGAGVIGLALVVTIGIALYNYGSETYWRLASSSLKKTPRPATDQAEVIRWINENAATSDVLVCYRDPVYYLYTGRKATQSVFLRYGGFTQPDFATIQQKARVIFRIIKENNADYFVINPRDFDMEFQSDIQLESVMELLEQHPEIFASVFRSIDGRSAIYRIDPAQLSAQNSE